MRRSLVICGLALCASIVAVGSAGATVGKCQRTLLNELATYNRKTIQRLKFCEDKIVTGKPGYPPGTDCRTDPVTASKLLSRQQKFIDHVRSACGGKNKTCSAADTGDDTDVPLSAIGWAIGMCPDFEGAGCTNSIADCGDVTQCLMCITNAAQDQATSLYYDALDVPSSDHALQHCQRTIGQTGTKFLRKKVDLLKKCDKKVLSSSIPGPCPDGDTQTAIAALELSLRDKICVKCGGDSVCGGAEAQTPSAIGFASTCPNVTIPGGASCAGTINTLQELVDCVACVTEFKADCVEPLGAPTLESYPSECQATP